MAKQVIGVGTTADDGTGDTLRAAFVKVNANTTELYDFKDTPAEIDDVVGLSAELAVTEAQLTTIANDLTAVPQTGSHRISGVETVGDTELGLVTYDSAMDKTWADGGTIFDTSVSIANQGTGTGTGCYVRTDHNVIVEHYRPNGVSDQAVVAKAMLAAYRLERDVVGGNVVCSASVIGSADPSPSSYWLSTSTKKPPALTLKRITATHNGTALSVLGRTIGSKIDVGHIVGTGVSLPYATVDGGAERIGLLVEGGGHDIKIGTFTGLNIATLLKSAYSGRVVVGQHVACAKNLATRQGSQGTTQGFSYQCIDGGGVYTNNTFTSPTTGDTVRKANSADIGADLDYIHGCSIDLGPMQYCGMTSTSIAVKLGDAARDNDISVYLEGLRDQQKFIDCVGFNNDIHVRSGMGSPQNGTLTGGVYLGGLGNKMFGVDRMTLAAAATATSTATGVSPIIVLPGNEIVGRNVIASMFSKPESRGNQLLEDGAIAFSGTATRVVAYLQVPGIGHKVATTRFTSATDSLTLMTSSNVTVPANFNGFVRVGIIAKNELADKGGQIAIYVEDHAGVKEGMTDRQGQTLSLPLSGEWTYMSFMEPIRTGSTSVRVRVGIRNGNSNNYQVITTNPWLSFDENYDPRKDTVRSKGIDISAAAGTSDTVYALPPYPIQGQIQRVYDSTGSATGTRRIAITALISGTSQTVYIDSAYGTRKYEWVNAAYGWVSI